MNASNSMIAKFLKYYHTLKYLKPAQLYAQVYFRLRRHPKINLASPPQLRQPVNAWVSSIPKQFVRPDPQHIILLNQKIDIASPTVWNDPNLDKLLLYHLHYLDVLKDMRCEKTSKSFLSRWITENPPARRPAWEPYPLSLRIVNMIKWFLNSNAQREDDILQSLVVQVSVLSQKLEKHLLGNHLLANGKALIFAGLFFAGRDAETWLAKGIQLFDQQIAEQILADGGHIERSPMYHAIILEDILDLLNLFKTFIPTSVLTAQQDSWNLALPTFAALPRLNSIAHLFQKLVDLSTSMINWLEKMTHEDGEIAFFNDATGGIAATIKELKHYQKNLNLPSPKMNDKNEPVHRTSLPNFKHLTESGYCCVHDENFRLLLDIGDIGPHYQPGHGHADTFSFELSVHKQRLFINSGISTYEESPERLRQRGTQAHNTLMINDQNSSEVWKSFRVAKRAKIQHVQIYAQNQDLIVQATHDGYLSRYQLFHMRTWAISKNQVRIVDTVNPKKLKRKKEKFLFELNFHVHPDISIEQLRDHLIHFYDRNGNHLAILSTDYPLNITDSSYHPEFNLTIPNKKFCYIVEQSLPFSAHASIEWMI